MSERTPLQIIPGGRAGAPAREPARPGQRQPGEQQPERRSAGEPRPEPLWREVLGDQLRERRKTQRCTLVETAGRAGISPQYLSEVERGRKEPSSEMIAALAGALGTSLGELTGDVAEALRRTRPIRAVHSRVTPVGGPVPGATGPVLLAA